MLNGYVRTVAAVASIGRGYNSVRCQVRLLNSEDKMNVFDAGSDRSALPEYAKPIRSKSSGTPDELGGETLDVRTLIPVIETASIKDHALLIKFAVDSLRARIAGIDAVDETFLGSELNEADVPLTALREASLSVLRTVCLIDFLDEAGL